MRSQAFFSDLRDRGKVLVFGHRGMSQYYPENTMISFSKCAENPKIDAIELDVHTCKSGEVVIAHDFSLKRTAGIDVQIEDLSLDEIQDIDVGSFKDPSFSDARIPLLSDVFSAFSGRFIYDIELKVKAGQINRDLCRKVLHLIHTYHLQDRVLVSSFNPFALRAFRTECLKSLTFIPTADIFERSEYVPKILWNGAGHFVSRSTYQKPGISRIDDAFVRSHGRLPIMAWTVNSASDAERLLSYNKVKMHVFGLIGNNPDMLCDVVNLWTR